jgi:UDP-2,3-diacylglucosamine pyrophosphatase LpxH
VTLQACAYIRSQKLIKYVICGHMHFNHETQSPTQIRQLVTGLDTLRQITVV